MNQEKLAKRVEQAGTCESRFEAEKMKVSDGSKQITDLYRQIALKNMKLQTVQVQLADAQAGCQTQISGFKTATTTCK